MLTRVLWIVALAAAIAGPVAARSLTTERNPFWSEMVTVTGLLATSLVVVVVVMASRVHSITRAFGLQTVIGCHRYLGLLAVLMSLAHVAAVVVGNPANVLLLSPMAPLRAIAGLIALILLCAIGGLSRMRSNQGYESWRWTHVGLTAGMLVTVAAHVVLIGHLIYAPLEGAFLGALAGGVLAALAARWVAGPLSSRARFVVLAVRAESPTVSTIVLRPRTGDRRFAPGQFAWLRLRRVPSDEHPFTISSAATDGSRLTFTFRHRRGGAAEEFLTLRPGDAVWVDGPHGNMTPDDRPDSGLVLIAAGVGITPMMSILRTLAGRNDDRSVRLILADSPDETLFRAELQHLRTRLAMDVIEVRREPITSARLASVLPGPFVRARLDYFICGSPRLVMDATTSLVQLGVPPRRVHTELFDLM